MNLKEAKLKHQSWRHYFFLNPYRNVAFTKCPRCQTKTLVRKFPLVIHIEPRQIFILNKQCRYCTRCDLIIARKSEIETLMTVCFEEKNPEIVGNDYLIMSTLEKRTWRARNSFDNDVDTLERTYVFKGVWDFELVCRGWYPTKQQ